MYCCRFVIVFPSLVCIPPDYDGRHTRCLYTNLCFLRSWSDDLVTCTLCNHHQCCQFHHKSLREPRKAWHLWLSQHNNACNVYIIYNCIVNMDWWDSICNTHFLQMATVITTITNPNVEHTPISITKKDIIIKYHDFIV